MAKEIANTTQCNPGEDRFGDDLKKFIDQLESIRRIKMITESENYTIKKMEDELTQKRNKINELEEKIAKLEQDQKDIASQSKKSKKECTLPCWIIMIGVIAFGAFFVFFAYCSLLLLTASVCVCNPQKLIPLLVGGILVLMIMAVILIVVGNQTKHVFIREKECS